ncbi:Acetylcholine receptor subunit alpha-like 1 [Eumeta japonica]|uniref:Acetylcholine receptor subunit alpha-like 1 n=1 Tax=Eumeta variegata TaxID=151549 RepID=A0A4C2A2M9_EUMVA|nr:Acetylcholine receptor subunit alpha-like 1 [Eumeta japonica]
MVLVLVVGVLCAWGRVSANPEAKRLYDDLLSNYNRLIRPVGNNSDRLTVKMGLRLSQLIDVSNKENVINARGRRGALPDHSISLSKLGVLSFSCLWGRPEGGAGDAGGGGGGPPARASLGRVLFQNVVTSLLFHPSFVSF